MAKKIAPPDLDFNPRAPSGARHCSSLIFRMRSPLFQSTRSERSATSGGVAPICCVAAFQSTRSERSATAEEKAAEAAGFAISIHALRAERDMTTSLPIQLFEISIHALRAERDFSTGTPWSLCSVISIHALRAERDHRLRL